MLRHLTDGTTFQLPAPLDRLKVLKPLAMEVARMRDLSEQERHLESSEPQVTCGILANESWFTETPEGKWSVIQ